MPRQPTPRLALGLLALAVWALPHAARACSCLVPPAPPIALERADAVFEARVENIAADLSSSSGAGLVRYDLEVLRQWKGELKSAVQLTSRANSAACGRSLTVGKVYLIYASKQDDGQLTDNLCSRTRLASTADEDLAALGPGTTPGNRPVTEPTNREPPRIAPPPPDLGGPAPLASKGCSLAGEPGRLAGLAGLAGLAMAMLRRRKGSLRG